MLKAKDGKERCTLTGDFYTVSDTYGLAVPELGTDNFTLPGVDGELRTGHFMVELSLMFDGRMLFSWRYNKNDLFSAQQHIGARHSSYTAHGSMPSTKGRNKFHFQRDVFHNQAAKDRVSDKLINNPPTPSEVHLTRPNRFPALPERRGFWPRNTIEAGVGRATDL